MLPGGRSLVVLEPASEGPLAAILARYDEGPRIAWVESATHRRARHARPGRRCPGRSGENALWRGRRADGLHRLLVPAVAGYHPPMTDQATILLRPAEPSDAEAIARTSPMRAIPAGPSDIVARLERFATPDARVIVAEHDGAILGFIAIHALPRFEHDDWIVRILALVVDAGARERGVGRTLMAEAERVGRELAPASSR